MKRLFSLILVGMLAVSGLSAKVKLSVLYVGGTANMDPMLMAPGSVDSVALAASVKERMAHFTKFLKKNFTNVKSIEGKDYTPEMSAAYDVTVFDGRTVPFRKGDRMKGERDSYLPESFDRAAVMIGHMSEELGRNVWPARFFGAFICAMFWAAVCQIKTTGIAFVSITMLSA